LPLLNDLVRKNRIPALGEVISDASFSLSSARRPINDANAQKRHQGDVTSTATNIHDSSCIPDAEMTLNRGSSCSGGPPQMMFAKASTETFSGSSYNEHNLLEPSMRLTPVSWEPATCELPILFRRLHISFRLEIAELIPYSDPQQNSRSICFSVFWFVQTSILPLL
jgi:hypothetical protein